MITFKGDFQQKRNSAKFKDDKDYHYQGKVYIFIPKFALKENK